MYLSYYFIVNFLGLIYTFYIYQLNTKFRQKVYDFYYIRVETIQPSHFIEFWKNYVFL